jgi:hypothetical protein
VGSRSACCSSCSPAQIVVTNACPRAREPRRGDGGAPRTHPPLDERRIGIAGVGTPITYTRRPSVLIIPASHRFDYAVLRPPSTRGGRTHSAHSRSLGPTVVTIGTTTTPSLTQPAVSGLPLALSLGECDLRVRLGAQREKFASELRTPQTPNPLGRRLPIRPIRRRTDPSARAT